VISVIVIEYRIILLKETLKQMMEKVMMIIIKEKILLLKNI
jgi:hypothetical protein